MSHDALQRIKDVMQLAEMEGLKPDDPEFQYRITDVKVKTCQEHYGLSSCNHCERNEDCDTVKYHLQVSMLRLKAKPK